MENGKVITREEKITLETAKLAKEKKLLKCLK